MPRIGGQSTIMAFVSFLRSCSDGVGGPLGVAVLQGGYLFGD